MANIEEARDYESLTIDELELINPFLESYLKQYLISDDSRQVTDNEAYNSVFKNFNVQSYQASYGEREITVVFDVVAKSYKIETEEIGKEKYFYSIAANIKKVAPVFKDGFNLDILYVRLYPTEPICRDICSERFYNELRNVKKDPWLVHLHTIQTIFWNKYVKWEYNEGTWGNSIDSERSDIDISLRERQIIDGLSWCGEMHVRNSLQLYENSIEDKKMIDKTLPSVYTLYHQK